MFFFFPENTVLIRKLDFTVCMTDVFVILLFKKKNPPVIHLRQTERSNKFPKNNDALIQSCVWD